MVTHLTHPQDVQIHHLVTFLVHQPLSPLVASPLALLLALLILPLLLLLILPLLLLDLLPLPVHHPDQLLPPQDKLLLLLPHSVHLLAKLLPLLLLPQLLYSHQELLVLLNLLVLLLLLAHLVYVLPLQASLHSPEALLPPVQPQSLEVLDHPQPQLVPSLLLLLLHLHPTLVVLNTKPLLPTLSVLVSCLTELPGLEITLILLFMVLFTPLTKSMLQEVSVLETETSLFNQSFTILKVYPTTLLKVLTL